MALDPDCFADTLVSVLRSYDCIHVGNESIFFEWGLGNMKAVFE